MMQNYLPIDVTREAKRVAEGYRSARRTEVSSPMPTIHPRIPQVESLDSSKGRKEVKIQVRSNDAMGFGHETIDLRGIEQLVDLSQTRAVGYALNLAARRLVNGKMPLREIVEAVMALLDREGLDVLDPFHRQGRHPGNFARPRRLRNCRCSQSSKDSQNGGKLINDVGNSLNVKGVEKSKRS